MNSRRVVHAEDIDGLDFKVGGFELLDDPAEGEGGVRTGEDVLVHAAREREHPTTEIIQAMSESRGLTIKGEGGTGLRASFYSQYTPDEILKLPTSPNPRHLEDHHTIIRQQLIHLLQESGVSPDPDVLGHLET